MANPHTSTALLESLKRRAQFAASSGSLSTDDFLAFLTEEARTYIMPLLMSVREEYAVANYDVALVAGQTSYAIPPRAIGNKLKSVYSVSGSEYTQLPRIEPEHSYGSADGSFGYYLEGSYVVLVGAPTGTSLRMRYFQRPGTVVATDAVGEITYINTSTRVVGISSLPAAFNIGETFDLVKGTPSFDTLAMDRTASAVTTTVGTPTTYSVTFSATLPTGLALGDFVCLAGQTPIPQIPVELHPLLVQRVVVKTLEAVGDPKVKVAGEICEDMKKHALTLLTPRVEAAVRPIINFNGPGFGRRRR